MKLSADIAAVVTGAASGLGRGAVPAYGDISPGVMSPACSSASGRSIRVVVPWPGGAAIEVFELVAARAQVNEHEKMKVRAPW